VISWVTLSQIADLRKHVEEAAEAMPEIDSGKPDAVVHAERPGVFCCWLHTALHSSCKQSGLALRLVFFTSNATPFLKSMDSFLFRV